MVPPQSFHVTVGSGEGMSFLFGGLAINAKIVLTKPTAPVTRKAISKEPVESYRNAINRGPARVEIVRNGRTDP